MSRELDVANEYANQLRRMIVQLVDEWNRWAGWADYEAEVLNVPQEVRDMVARLAREVGKELK